MDEGLTALGVIRKSLDYLDDPETDTTSDTEDDVERPDVFIVYGHDRGARFEVAHHIETDLKLHAIMLDRVPQAATMAMAEAVEAYAKTTRIRGCHHDS